MRSSTATAAPARAATTTEVRSIHKGTCSNLDPKPTYPLSPVANGKSGTIVKAPLDDLSKGGYAINVHKSTQDLKTYVSCGEIAAKSEPLMLVSTQPPPARTAAMFAPRPVAATPPSEQLAAP